MSEQNRGNREKIVQAAITLLDECGYEGVSMRDVARLAGIKASSIYNHFTGKDQMLDAVVAAFEAALDARGINRPDPVGDEAGLADPPKLLLSIMAAPLALLEDEQTVGIIRIVTRCQHRHAGIRSFLSKEMFDRPLRRITDALERLQAHGCLSGEEGWTVDFLAAELQSVFVAEYYRMSLHGWSDAPDADRVRQALAAHVDFFWKAAGKEAGV